VDSVASVLDGAIGDDVPDATPDGSAPVSVFVGAVFTVRLPMAALQVAL